MLKVKKLREDAIIPTVANPGEDLGFDLYALEDTVLLPGKPTKVRTGIAAEFDVRRAVPSTLAPGYMTEQRVPYGLLIRDRSSMASKGITVSAGVVDAGYRGEILVLLTLSPNYDGAFYAGKTEGDDGYVVGYEVGKGDKIAQMIPLPVSTKNGVIEVDELSDSQRGEAGFGSTGK